MTPGHHEMEKPKVFQQHFTFLFVLVFIFFSLSADVDIEQREALALVNDGGVITWWPHSIFKVNTCSFINICGQIGASVTFKKNNYQF